MEAGNSSSGQATGSLSSASTSRHFVPVPPAAAVAELHRRAALLGSAGHKDYAWKLRHLQPMARMAPGVARRRLSGQRTTRASMAACTRGSSRPRSSAGCSPSPGVREDHRRGGAAGGALRRLRDEGPQKARRRHPHRRERIPALLLRLLGVTETDRAAVSSHTGASGREEGLRWPGWQRQREGGRWPATNGRRRRGEGIERERGLSCVVTGDRLTGEWLGS
jgi:hypothetical protein